MDTGGITRIHICKVGAVVRAGMRAGVHVRIKVLNNRESQQGCNT